MPTHPIGPGTCNLSVNVRKSFRLALGRVAFAADVSMGELVRRMIRVPIQLRRAGAAADRAFDLDAQAIARLRQAQQPDSEGGTTITPHEAQEVETLIARSGLADRRIAHALSLQEIRS